MCVDVWLSFLFHNRDPLKNEEEVLGLVIVMSSSRSAPLVARSKKFALGPPGHFVLFIFVMFRKHLQQRQCHAVSGQEVMSGVHLGQLLRVRPWTLQVSLESKPLLGIRFSCLCRDAFFYNSMQTQQTLCTSQAVCFVFCLSSFIHLCDSDVGWEWGGGCIQ